MQQPVCLGSPAERYTRHWSKKNAGNLDDTSRAPKVVHNKTPEVIEEKVIKLKKKTNYGPLRLKEELEAVHQISLSQHTIRNIVRRNKKKATSKRHKPNKKGPRPFIDWYTAKPFEVVQIDLKYVVDQKALSMDQINHIYAHKLPIYQWGAIGCQLQVQAYCLFRRKKLAVLLLTANPLQGYNRIHMNALSDLNEQQYTAVTAETGATLILAGPGSGKTRVLTHRIAYLIRDLGVRPYNILAVTFTNKASKEMKTRLESMLPGKAEGVWLGTFHSICARILRREAGYLPVDSNFVIYDTDDQVSLLKSIIKDMNLNDKIYRAGSIQATISRAKNEMIVPKDYLVKTSRDGTIRDIYDRYEKGLRLSNAVDFDDLLLLAVYLLGQYQEVRERYARRFEFVLVDEFQDTNTIQYELVKLLSSVHQQIFVVGDEDQSIYRWRGADYKNVLRFEHDFSNSQKILLEQNYRSTQIVLDVAKAVINRNRNRTPKDLFTKKAGNELVHVYNADDDRDEADYVVADYQIPTEKRGSGRKFCHHVPH